MPVTRWITIGVTVAVLAGLGGFAWNGLQPAPMPEGLAWGNGRLEATEVGIATKRPGRVVEISVDEGDAVVAGQTLARIDTQDLEADLREAQARSNEARQALGHATAMVAERESVLALAAKQFRRSSELSRQGHVAGQTLDEDRSRRETAEAALRAAQAMVVQAQAAIEAATAKEERIKVDLADAILTSPVSGRVLYRLVEPGEILPGGGRVLSVLDMTDIYVTIFLPMRDASRVSIGAEARIVLDAEPQLPIAGRLSFVAPTAQFTPKEVETRSEREKLTFRAKVTVNPDALNGRLAQMKTGLPAMAYVRIEPNAAWPALSVAVRDD
jgi:HlyD family secretion protein